MTTITPFRYREVAYTTVDVPLTPQAVSDLLLGREAYRRTRFIVARHGEDVALLRVDKVSEEPLFSPITAVEMLSGPAETVFVHAPEVDVGVPSQLGRVAVGCSPKPKAVVVQGRYEHVSFIFDPTPLIVRVAEVAPPTPAKLIDQVHRVLEVGEDLAPICVEPCIFDLADLAAHQPADHYLFPCRGSGAAASGAQVDYLDERPPKSDWVLVGCERSRQIHRHFYGSDPPTIEMCPRELLREHGDLDVPTLTKCCQLEETIESEGQMVVVPWGATLHHVADGLNLLVEKAGVSWVRG